MITKPPVGSQEPHYIITTTLTLTGVAVRASLLCGCQCQVVFASCGSDMVDTGASVRLLGYLTDSRVWSGTGGGDEMGLVSVGRPTGWQAVRKFWR